MNTKTQLTIAAQALEQSIGGQAACLRAVELTLEALRGAVPAAIEVTADNDAAYGYQDGWNACRKAMLAAAPQPATQQEPASDLLNLLARIHRDGGHYVQQHGLSKAVEDADLIVARMNAQQEPAGEPVAWMPKTWTERYVSGVEAVTCYLRPTTGWIPLYTRPAVPLTDEQKRNMVKECGLDWHRGYMPLFDDDPTNRYAVLIEAVEAAHKIGGAE